MPSQPHGQLGQVGQKGAPRWAAPSALGRQTQAAALQVLHFTLEILGALGARETHLGTPKQACANRPACQRGTALLCGTALQHPLLRKQEEERIRLVVAQHWGQTPRSGLMSTAPSPGEPGAHSTPAHTSSLPGKGKAKTWTPAQDPTPLCGGHGRDKLVARDNTGCKQTPHQPQLSKHTSSLMWGCALWCRSAPIPYGFLQHHQSPGTDPSCPPGTAWDSRQLGVLGRCGGDEPLHWAGRGERVLEARRLPSNPSPLWGQDRAPIVPQQPEALPAHPTGLGLHKRCGGSLEPASPHAPTLIPAGQSSAGPQSPARCQLTAPARPPATAHGHFVLLKATSISCARGSAGPRTGPGDWPHREDARTVSGDSVQAAC